MILFVSYSYAGEHLQGFGNCQLRSRPPKDADDVKLLQRLIEADAKIEHVVILWWTVMQ